MKKVLTVLLSLVLLASALVISPAATSDDDWKDLDYSLVLQLLDGYALTADGEVLNEGKYCMRGFAVSPDGRYLFAGMLNPNTNSAIEVFDTTTGKPCGTYSYTQPDNDKKSYPKGLDCDDRGYLYAGLAYSANYGTAHFAILDYSQKGSDGYLKEISRTQILQVSDPGDSSGTKVGVNGVAVQQILGSYYLYVVVNYDVDYLYRFDVNDPTHPIPDTSFGNNGRIDLHDAAYAVDGANLTEGNYLDVDEDGTIYMGYTTASGAGLIKLSEDGRSVLGSVAQPKGYGVAIYEDYVLCSTQSSGNFVVYSKYTLAPVASFSIMGNIKLPVPEENDKVFDFGVASICNIKVANGVLYFADQGTQNAPDQVFVTALTAEGKAEIKKMTDVLAELLKVEATEAPTAAPTAAPTEAPTAAPTDEPTEPAAQPTEQPTSAPDPATDAPKPEKKGCGSAVAALPVLAALAVVFVRRKKED